MTVKRTYEKHEADKITFRYRDQVVAASSDQSGSGGFMENSAGKGSSLCGNGDLVDRLLDCFGSGICA